MTFDHQIVTSPSFFLLDISTKSDEIPLRYSLDFTFHEDGMAQRSLATVMAEAAAYKTATVSLHFNRILSVYAQLITSLL